MIYKKIDNIFSRISGFVSWISAVVIFLMSAIIFVSVISRYFFNSPITGVEELIQIGLCVYVYTALGYAIRHDKMISVPVITEKLSNKAEQIIKGIGNILCAVIGFLIMYELTIPLIKKMGNLKKHSTTLLHFPEGYIFLIVTICYALISLEFILRAVRNFMDSSRQPENALPEMKEIEVK